MSKADFTRWKAERLAAARYVALLAAALSANRVANPDYSAEDVASAAKLDADALMETLKR